MSTLSDIFAAIVADLQARGWSTLASRVGSKYLANNEDALPRVVFIPPRPGEESFEAPDFVGQRPGHRPAAFRTRIAPVEIHAAAATFNDTERLGHDLSSSIHRLCYGAYSHLGAGYLSENESGWSAYGEVYVLRVAFRQPILALPMGQAATAANVDAVLQKSEIQFPDGDVEVDVPYPP